MSTQSLEKPLPLCLHATRVTLPLVINQGAIEPFNYWHQGTQRGMRYQKELYAYFHFYSISERLTAYAIAYEQAELNLSTCITVSQSGYTVWINLRSLNMPSVGA